MPGAPAAGSGDGAGVGADPTTEPAAACQPAGPAVAVTAAGIAWDADCLAAPAGTAFTIELDNTDSVPHNLAILAGDGTGDPLFRGEIFQGPATRTYDVPALAAGTYRFRCDVHPAQMEGTFVVA